MDIIEKFSTISEIINGLTDFVQNDEAVSADFSEYLTTIGAGKDVSDEKIQSICLPYIFERNIDSKSIIDIFLESKKKLTKGAKLILKALTNSTSSIFEVKKILKNGFEFYNLVNEKAYDVISLVKMTHFRGVGIGQYVVARIFELE
nr:hypothetical protein [bacterium]